MLDAELDEPLDEDDEDDEDAALDELDESDLLDASDLLDSLDVAAESDLPAPSDLELAYRSLYQPPPLRWNAAAVICLVSAPPQLPHTCMGGSLNF